MPLNSVPATVNMPALEYERLFAAQNAFVDIGFWGGAVPGNKEDLRPLHDDGVFGFKCFLLHSGGGRVPPPGGGRDGGGARGDYATPESTRWWGDSQAERVRTSGFADRAREEGLSPDEVEQIAFAWQDWGHSPDAWFCMPHGEVIARPDFAARCARV